MAELQQVFGGFGGGGNVVDPDVGCPQAHDVLAGGDDRNRRRLRCRNGACDAGRQSGAEQYQPVGFPAIQHLRITVDPLLVVLTLAEQHFVAMLVGDVFDTLDDSREKRVMDIRNDDDDVLGAAAPQTAGDGIGPVIPLAHCRLDAGARRGLHEFG